VFSIGQTTAVASAFRLAGYDGPLRVASEFKGDERVFILVPEALASIRDVRGLEQLLQQLLSLKIAITSTSVYPRETEHFE
jgi:hypothetical protein